MFLSTSKLVPSKKSLHTICPMQYLHFLDDKNHPIWTHLICEVKVNVFVVYSWFDFHLQLQEGKEPVRLKCVYLNFNRWTILPKYISFSSQREDYCRATNQMYQKWFEYVKNPNIKYILKFFIPWFNIVEQVPSFFVNE